MGVFGIQRGIGAIRQLFQFQKAEVIAVCGHTIAQPETCKAAAPVVRLDVCTAKFLSSFHEGGDNRVKTHFSLLKFF